jgi:anti-anti-sigma factor
MAACAQTDFPDFFALGLRIVVSHEGAKTTIALDGEWDLAERERMSYTIRKVLRRVVLDLRRLTFMDSSGIHGVVELARGAARLKIGLVVIPGPRAVRRLFEVCQLPEAITLVNAA